MHSLLYRITLLKAIVAVLVSCVIQTQVTGVSTKGFFAVDYIKKAGSTKGLSSVKWIGGSSQASYAFVNYKNQKGFMNCRRNASPYGFKNLEFASHSLVGPDAEYSNYVAAPLGVIQIIADIAPNNGCCFIYHYNDGITLEQYLAKRNYAEQLIALNQVMPQVIKGSIYLYNTDVTYTGLQRDEIIIQEDKKTGKLTAMLASAYQTFSFRQGTLKLNDKTTRANGANSQVLYNCNGFQKAYTLILKGFISVLFLQHPPNFSAEERIDIEAKVKRAANKKMHLRSVSDIVIKQATEAYIVFLKASYLANNGKDCSSLVATLQALYPESSA